MRLKSSRTRKVSQTKATNAKEESEVLIKKDKVDDKRQYLQRRESKVSMWAPPASETEFEDVPVLTFCPFCEQKIVTKTHFSKKKLLCFCCCICSEDLTYMFKDIIHVCPKCNNEIAKYNRFCFCFKRSKKPKKVKNNNKVLEYEEMKSVESSEASNSRSNSQFSSSSTDASRINTDGELRQKAEPALNDVQNNVELADISNFKTIDASPMETISEDSTQNTPIVQNHSNDSTRKKSKKFSLSKKTVSSKNLSHPEVKK